MHYKYLAAAVLTPVLLAAAPATAWQMDCRVSKTVSAGIDVTDANKIVVRAGAGDLDLRGVSGATRVEARGGACAPNQSLLEATRVEIRREGTVIYVETIIPREDGDSGRINLGLAVPGNIALEVTDSSGDALISNVAAIDIEDSSGDLTIRNVRGAVTAVDSSGDLLIDGAQSVRATDSSGNIEISNVATMAEVDADTSGDIRLRSIKGNATVRADSSGDIHAADIGGDFRVDVDGSGSITHDRIRGVVSVPN